LEATVLLKDSSADGRLVHLKLAHALWAQHLQDSDSVVDATLGNGHDCAYLVSLLGPQGSLVGFDIQQQAIEKTQQRLNQLNTSLPSIELNHACHSTLLGKGFSLIVYNLGYLPGADKRVTTQVESTLESLKKSVQALRIGGALSVMTYPGHDEGAREHEAVERWLRQEQALSLFHFYRIDRRRSPHLFFALLKK
jgi:hypothetical protein